MINLNSLLKYGEIEKLGYDSVYLEKPVADIVDFNWKNILPRPPSNTSKQTLLELDFVSKATISRNYKDIEQVFLFDSLFEQKPNTLFASLTNEYNVKYPYNDINAFYSIIRPIIFNTKGIWNRPRPAQLAKYYNIPLEVIVTDTHHTASYPSGHTVYSSLIAMILKHHYPIIDQRKLDILVENTAKARILQGVHFPSDNKASIQLTKFLFDKLKEKLL